MKNMMEIRFKNKTERKKQWDQYVAAKNNLKVFGEVAPYYITWFLLACYRVDRTNSYNYLLFLILTVAVIEMQARLQYGTGKFDFLFELMYRYFPSNFTIGENMKLTRQLFPLIFQSMLVFCDFTIDAPYILTEDELNEQKKVKSKYTDFAKMQDEVIKKMQVILDQPEAPNDDQLENMYTDIRVLDHKGYQEMMFLRGIELKNKAPGFSIMSIFKTLIGLGFMFSILKMLLFPDHKLSEAEKMNKY